MLLLLLSELSLPIRASVSPPTRFTANPTPIPTDVPNPAEPAATLASCRVSAFTARVSDTTEPPNRRARVLPFCSVITTEAAPPNPEVAPRAAATPAETTCATLEARASMVISSALTWEFSILASVSLLSRFVEKPPIPAPPLSPPTVTEPPADIAKPKL